MYKKDRDYSYKHIFNIKTKGYLSNMNPIFFCSDLHFGHYNIIRYCGRPFSSVEDMNEQLIANWNKVIPQNGLVYFLGDMFFSEIDKSEAILNRLNGRIYCIRGNHDKNMDILQKRNPQKLIWLKDYFELRVSDSSFDRGNCKLVLFHYPIASWNGSGHGSFHLHGHCHGTFPDNETSKFIDVGIDAVARKLGNLPLGKLEDSYIQKLVPENYRPMSYDEIKTIMSSKIFKPIDHHGE